MERKEKMMEENSYPSDVRMEMEIEYIDGATFCAYYLFNNHISSFLFMHERRTHSFQICYRVCVCVKAEKESKKKKRGHYA